MTTTQPPANKLTTEQEKRFDDKFGAFWENIEKYYVHAESLKKHQIKQFLADEIAIEREQILNLPKMQLENVGLPTTKQAKQNNYDKKIRNQLRRMIENEILALKGK